MQFSVEHQISAPLSQIEAALFQREYYAHLLAESGLLLDVKVKACEDLGDRVIRQVHYCPKPAFDSIGPKKIPASWFEFIEESVYDKATRTLRFENVPVTDKVRRHFRNSGEIQLESLSAGLTVRRAKADLELHTLKLYLRPLRGLAESMIAREARKLLDAEAKLLDGWLRGRDEEPLTGPFVPIAG